MTFIAPNMATYKCINIKTMNTQRLLLRFAGVIMINYAISWILYHLTMWSFLTTITVGCSVIRSLFDFRTEDVTIFFMSISRNTGISPHWIHVISIGNFSTHITALLLNTLFISMLIYVTGWLKKIIKGSRFLTIVSLLTLLATLLDLYIPFYCKPTPIDNGFWLYCLKITIGLFFSVYIGATIYGIWNYKD